jgi:hypothetical protein
MLTQQLNTLAQLRTAYDRSVSSIAVNDCLAYRSHLAVDRPFIVREIHKGDACLNGDLDGVGVLLKWFTLTQSWHLAKCRDDIYPLDGAWSLGLKENVMQQQQGAAGAMTIRRSEPTTRASVRNAVPVQLAATNTI